MQTNTSALMLANMLSVAQSIADFDRKLGHGQDIENPLSWTAMPNIGTAVGYEEFVKSLTAVNFHRVYIPTKFGGERHNWLQLWLHIVQATRRNLNVMPAVMYSVGPIVALEQEATPYQVRRAYKLIESGDQFCFGLSEPETGTELLNLKARSVKNGNQWRVVGKKGPMGWSQNATQAMILVKTGVAGPSSLSLLWFDVEKSKKSIVAHKGIGMHQQKFVEMEFDYQGVKEDMLVGTEGGGFESTLKVQQVVKYLSTAANYGACHSLIRDVYSYSKENRNNRQLTKYAHVRFELACSLSDLLFTECAALAAGCSVGASKSQFSVLSSIAKHQAIESSDRIGRRVRDLLSIRYALNYDERHVRLHRVLDDLGMVRFMDTNPVANLRNIATQLPTVFTRWKKTQKEDSSEILKSLNERFHLGNAYYAPESMNLAVTNSGGDQLLNSVEALQETTEDDQIMGDVVSMLLRDIEMLRSRIEELGGDYIDSADSINIAKRYSTVINCLALIVFKIANSDFLLSKECIRAIVTWQTHPEKFTAQMQQCLFNTLGELVESNRALSCFRSKLFE